MNNLKKKIWIEAEVVEENNDPTDDNTDVIVRFSDNSKWVASFFTFKNIETIRRKNQETGESMNGLYYWGSDMILIENVTRECIERVIDGLIERGIFDSVFRRCEDEPFIESD
ncbi:hypothetical protein ACWKW1_23170 [Brevibacillus parabrevis]